MLILEDQMRTSDQNTWKTQLKLLYDRETFHFELLYLHHSASCLQIIPGAHLEAKLIVGFQARIFFLKRKNVTELLENKSLNKVLSA